MNNEEITRAEALKKMGKYAALTALGTMIILNPKQAQAMSGPGDNPSDPGGWGFKSSGRKRRSMFNN